MPQSEFSDARLGILHGITIEEPSRRKDESREKSKKKDSVRSTSVCDDHERPESSRGATKEARTTRFRFKKQKHSSDSPQGKKRRHTKESSNHSSSKRRRGHGEYHEQLKDDPAEYDDTYIPNTASWRYRADADVAFRESLFDAMADDEGAAFWEGVYGQPIHIYGRPDVETGNGLEEMNDEEYAEHVRKKMWERSHQHIHEERQKRTLRQQREKEKEKQAAAQWEREQRKLKMKEKLLREHTKKKDLRKRWEQYVEYWDTSRRQKQSAAAEDIPWPVLTGKARDVTKDAVEEFLYAALNGLGDGSMDILKRERIRWHPDKAQQRWGIEALTDMEMRAITTVFQTIDALWNEYRNKT